MTFKVEILGFKTKKQAETFISWYEGQGEQDACIWFECREAEGTLDVTSMHTDIEATYPLKWKGNTLKMVVSPE